MTLNEYFQISVSVFCTIATLAIIIFIIFGISLQLQIKKLIKKISEISEIAKTTATDSKAFVDRTIESLENFRNSIFTFEFVRQIITQVVELIQSNKRRSSKKR